MLPVTPGAPKVMAINGSALLCSGPLRVPCTDPRTSGRPPSGHLGCLRPSPPQEPQTRFEVLVSLPTSSALLFYCIHTGLHPWPASLDASFQVSDSFKRFYFIIPQHRRSHWSLLFLVKDYFFKSSFSVTAKVTGRHSNCPYGPSHTCMASLSPSLSPLEGHICSNG